MKQHNPILVTGAMRSGASMIAATINICGAFGGNMAGQNHTNKRGMFENVQIRDRIVKPYLEKINADPKGQSPLPEVENMDIPSNWQYKVDQVLIEEGYVGGGWMYKDSRSALIWPVWHYAFPDAKWVIVRRRTGDIVRSCLRTGYMTAYNTEKGWIEWVRQYEQRFVEMITEGLNCKIIWPERMVHGDYQQLYELCEWLGLLWKSEALNFIDPLLWGSRKIEKVR